MRLIRTAAVAVISISVLVAATACTPPAKPTLQDISEGIGQFRYGLSAADWSSVEASTTEFGADYLRVEHAGDKPTITHVALENVKGHLTLTRVLVVPGGGIGNGFPWSRAGWHQDAPQWNKRESLPAPLSRVSGPTGAPANPTNTWQVVIGLRTSGDGGTTTGLLITYVSGGKTFSIHGGERFSVVKSKSQVLRA